MSCAPPIYTHTIGATGHELQVTINEDTIAAPLAGATVTLQLRHRKTRVISEFEMTAVAGDGRFDYQWGAEEPESGGGEYDARLEIELSNGLIVYAPTGEWMPYTFL